MSFHIFGATHMGGRHHSMFQNNQDSFKIGELPDVGMSYGIALDGCGSSSHSEVSVIYAHMLSDAIEEYAKQDDVQPTGISSYLFSRSIDFLTKQLSAMGFNESADKNRISEYIRDFWLFTVMVFVQFPKVTVILHKGDGVIRINDKVHVLDEGNVPRYIGYFLIPWDVPSEVLDQPWFSSLTISNRLIDVLMLGTDGWSNNISELLCLENEIKPEEGEKISELAHMRMSALMFNQQAFNDDATIIGLIRRE